MALDQQSPSPRRRLLVEDDGLTAATISDLLTSHGFLVETVPGAAEAQRSALDNGNGPGNDDGIGNATNAPGMGPSS